MIPVDPRDFATDAFAKIKPCCGECGSRDNVDIAPATIVYPNRADLWAHEDGGERWFWLCSSCWAYVGVHRASLKPLGSPAGKDTRLARADAHAAFDPLWRKRMALSGISQTKARNRGYKWLAEQPGRIAAWLREANVGKSSGVAWSAQAIENREWDND